MGTQRDKVGQMVPDGCRSVESMPKRTNTRKGTKMAVYGLNVAYPELSDDECSSGQCRPERDEMCDWHNPDVVCEYDEQGNRIEADEDDDWDIADSAGYGDESLIARMYSN